MATQLSPHQEREALNAAWRAVSERTGYWWSPGMTLSAKGLAPKSSKLEPMAGVDRVVAEIDAVLDEQPVRCWVCGTSDRSACGCWDVTEDLVVSPRRKARTGGRF